MSDVAQLAAEFPFVAALPRKEKSRVARLMDAVEALERANKEHGALIPQAACAEILGISRQRVGQLIDLGQLPAIDVLGQRMIPVAAFREFARRERKVGRPPTLRETLGKALRYGEAIGENVGKMAGLKE